MLSKDYTRRVWMALEVKVQADCKILRLMDRSFFEGTLWNAKEVEFLRSYLRLLFSCWLRFAASSQPEDNWRNTFRVVKCTPSENVCLSSLPQPLLLSTSHTEQKKDPGEHCNKEEADRGGEAEAPVHKGARSLWSQGPATGSKVSGRGRVAPTTKKVTANSPHQTQSAAIALGVILLSQS